MRPRTEFGAAGLQHNGRVRHQAPHHARQFEARLGIQLSVPGEFNVRHHAEQIVAILLHQRGRIFEIGTQQNFRPRLQAHQFVRHVDAFLNHAPRLLDQFGVDHRQKRRVIANIVFHHQQHGHANGSRVMQHVALILDVLDDGDQNARVALPKKDPFNVGDRIPRHEILDFAIVVAQHHDRNIQPGLLHLARQLRCVHVADG